MNTLPISNQVEVPLAEVDIQAIRAQGADGQQTRSGQHTPVWDIEKEIPLNFQMPHSAKKRQRQEDTQNPTASVNIGFGQFSGIENRGDEIGQRASRYRGKIPTEFDPAMERSDHVDKRRGQVEQDCVETF